MLLGRRSEARIKNAAKDLRKTMTWSNMGFRKTNCSHVSSVWRRRSMAGGYSDNSTEKKWVGTN